MEERNWEISWTTILRIGFVFFLLYLMYSVRDILVFLLFALIIAILFEIPIGFLTKKIPRALAVSFLYLSALFLIGLLIYLPTAGFMTEIGQFVKSFPVYFNEFSPYLRNLGLRVFQDLETFVASLTATLSSVTSNILSALFAVFGGITATIFVVSLAIFISLESKSLEKNLVLLFPKKDEEFILDLWQRCQKKVGLWFLKSIVSCLFVGLLSYVSFAILQVKYNLSLSLVAGALNFVPIIGPIFTSLLILAVVSLDSLTKALLVVLVFTVIQQIENNLFTPLLTKRFIDMSPVLVLVSLAVGGRLFGLLGAILAVPLVGVIVEFAKGLLERKRAADSQIKIINNQSDRSDRLE